MKLKEDLDSVKRVDKLIRRKATGYPSELAEKLGFSESGLYHFIKMLKTDFDFPIKYSRKWRRYYYEIEGEFVCEFIRKFEKFNKGQES